MAEKLQRAETAELDRLETVVDEALKATRDASTRAKLALVSIRDQRLYKGTHSSFEEYLWTRWRVSRTTGYRWISEGRSLLALEPGEQDTAEDKKSAEKDNAAGQRVPQRDTLSTQGDEPEIIEPPHMELDGKGAGVLDFGTVRSKETPKKGGRGRSPEGTPKSPQGADLRAGAPPETGDEGQSDTDTPPKSSTPQDGGDTSTPATPPPGGSRVSLVAAVKRVLMADEDELKTVPADLLADLVDHLRIRAFRSVGAKPKRAATETKVADCMHPPARRFGTTCYECGAENVKDSPWGKRKR